MTVSIPAAVHKLSNHMMRMRDAWKPSWKFEVPDDEQPPGALSTPLNAEEAPATSLWTMLSGSLGTRIEKHACALL